MRSEIERAVQLLKSGAPDSMDKALALLQETVFSFSMRVCNQREDAEDTMQEVLVKSVPVLPNFESPRALIVWLYKVARSRCLMSRRKSKFAPKQELSLEELMPDGKELARIGLGGQINPETFAINSQAAHRLRQAIQKLPPEYRIVLVLRDMEGLTDDEVAEITGLRSGTVRVRLHRARLFVRKELSREQLSAVGSRRSLAHAENRQQKADNRAGTPWNSGRMAEARQSRCKALFAELSNYIDEQLDDSLCEEVETHFHGCDPCKAFLSSLEATIEQIRKAPPDSPNSQKATRLRKQLMEHYYRVSALRR